MMISRRHFLKASAVLAGALLFDKKSFAAGRRPTRERSLNLYNIHTEEQLQIRYWVKGKYDWNEIYRIWHHLRCHHTNQIRPIDVGVIDLLCEIKDRFASMGEIHIVSGYRSPEYNAYLSSIGRHVSPESLHLSGLAIDFAIPGIPPRELSKRAVQFQAGGVGLYPDFVHIDVGRVRQWGTDVDKASAM